jgi:molybdenum cofactor cytidylyltransferase
VNGRRIIAMILAAGQSRRMGRSKQMLPYGDGTLLEAVIDAVLESSVDGLVIVTDPATATHMEGPFPERCFVVVNDDADSEMLASAKIGLRQIVAEFTPAPDDGVMVLLGDQPEVTGGTITTCAEAYRLPSKPPGILIAAYGGRRSHPTVFSLEVLAQIEAWPDDRGLNTLARRHPDAVRELAITTRPMPIDVNTPEDYDRLCGRD